MNNHFDQLVSVLDDYPGSMDALSLHGFLTALAIGPDEALEKPWLHEILNSPPGTALSENMEALGLHMMASLEQILGELTEERFHPRIKTPDKDNEAVKAWCRGFQQAVLLAESEWEAFHDRCPDAALKGVTIAAILRPELAEAMFGIPQDQHDLFVAEQAPLLGSTMETYYQAFTEIVFDEIADIDLEPPTMEELPRFSEEELTSKSNDELLHLLSIFDDSLPHVVILESIRREAPMVEKLNQYLADDKHWDEEQEFGEDSWWTRLHAIMILGGISGEKAGQSLISAFSRMPDYGDDPLWEWLAEYWPALFRNKPEGIHQMLHAMAENTSLDWYIRHHATSCVLAHAASKNQEALEQALDWLAGLIAAEDEDEEFRYMEGGTLLDFAPERHRPLLEKLADLQEDLGLGTIFLRSDINRAFKEGKNRPEWERFDNPWEFYDPEEILRRQQRWHSEIAARYSADEDEAYEEKEATWPNYHSSPVETYTREQPKVGRNEPCPCGSGKKYKKCCLQ